MAEISDSDLQQFARWYKKYFGKTEDEETLFVISMSGYFHSFPKRMLEELKRMVALSIIKRDKGKITVL